MSLHTVAEFKDSVAALLSGIDLTNVDNLNGALERAARVVVQKADIPEASGTQNITLYSGVYDYLCDPRIFGTAINDIRPQGITRNVNNFVTKIDQEDFDRTKAWYNPLETVSTFHYTNGVPVIRIKSPFPQQQVIIDPMNAIGTSPNDWEIAVGANGLAQDFSNFYQSPASLRFTLDDTNQDLITNGGFSGNDSGWTVGSGWTHGTDKENFSVGATGYVAVPAQTGLDATGSGYTVGDVLTLVGGGGNAKITVTQLDGSGNINDWEISQVGSGYSVGVTYATTGGTGSGATFLLNFISTLALSQPTTGIREFTYTLSVDYVGDGSVDSELYIYSGATLAGAEVVQTQNLVGSGTLSTPYNPQTANETLFFLVARGPTSNNPMVGSITNISVIPTNTQIGTLTKTLQSPIDLSTYEGVGVAFLAIQIPTGTPLTGLTSIQLSLGSDSDNYNFLLVTQGFLGAWVAGDWLLVAFDFSLSTTIGTPNWTNIQYVNILFSYANTMINFHAGYLFMSMPSPAQILYQTAAVFLAQGTTTPTTTITADTDTILFNDGAYTIYEYEGAAAICQQTGGSTGSQMLSTFNSILNGIRARNGAVIELGLYDMFRADNPSQEIRTSGSWYDNSNGYNSNNGW